MIKGIDLNQGVVPVQKKMVNKSGTEGFADAFKNAFDNVNQQSFEADKKIEGLATGKNKDIHGTMIAMEKADVSLRLLMAVKNKVVSAYEEVMRMQV